MNLRTKHDELLCMVWFRFSGPHAQTQQDLAGTYFDDIGLGTCSGPGCVPTVEASINTAGQGAAAQVVLGCPNRLCPKADIEAVKAAVIQDQVQVIIMAMGLDSKIESEGKDRTDIRLPGQQLEVIETVLNNSHVGTKLVLLLFNGGTIAIESLKNHPALAIVECWYPGATGATALAETVFGFPGKAELIILTL